MIEEQQAGGYGTRPGLEVRRAVEEDLGSVKAVRLAALAESPRAFGATLAEESAYTEAGWRAWCRDTATFLTLQDGVPVGMAAGVSGAGQCERKVIAMWVHPGHRRSGAGSSLLEAVTQWARLEGATALTLWLARGNPAAATLYRRAGFSATGACKPLPSHPDLVEDQLRLELP